VVAEASWYRTAWCQESEAKKTCMRKERSVIDQGANEQKLNDGKQVGWGEGGKM